MKQIIGAFSMLFVLMLNIFICISIGTVSGDVAAAKEYKTDVIAEIENSNFNPNVIDSCILQAKEQGYTLQITNCVYDENSNIQTAEVILSYDYKIPLFGIKDTKMTGGIAR